VIRVSYVEAGMGRGIQVQGDRLLEASKDRLQWKRFKERDIARATDADVVYVHDTGLVPFVKAVRDVPVVCHIVAQQLFTGAEQASKVIVPTEFLKRACPQAEVLWNAVPDSFSPGPSDPQLARALPVVLYTGSLHQAKGVGLLIEAVRDLPCELWIVGPADKRMEGNVTYWGQRGDLLRFYRSSNVFTLPSASEGMSLALLEAMQVGLPCVASDIPPNVETLRGAGVVCARTVPALRAALEELLGSEEKRRTLGEAALAVAQTRPFSGWVNRIVEIITSCS
jgi:glycosyltransferase involved in cell wall biosynthesis